MIYFLCTVLGVLLLRIILGKYFSRFILFLFAYIPIYIIIIIKSINLNVMNSMGGFLPMKLIFMQNITPFLMFLLIISLLMLFYIYQRNSLRAKGNPKFKIKSIDDNNKEYVTYLGTYILPFVAIETKGVSDIVAYIFLFLLMGFIFSRTNLIYTNPMLMFFNYDIFDITDENGIKHLCISKEKFKIGDEPIGVKLGEKTFIIQKWKKEILERK